ncbi:MAG TPA: helix-turn-helix domain-containing protein [Thermoplasmata archaeon]|nr:helix-turn-helix domain-containing protein [Thermoplasmata archaeon]
MQKQVSVSRELDGRFQEYRYRTTALVEDIRRIAAARFPQDALQNAQANLEVARTIFTKWTLEIMVTLFSLHAVGFEELRRQLKGISPRVLSGRLKTLEARNLILRRVLNDRPPRVQYRLTNDGLMLARLGEPVFLFLRLRTRSGRTP